MFKYIEKRQAESVLTFKTFRDALDRYSEDHTNVAWGRTEYHYPPHLAALVAGGYLKAGDLVLPHSGTAPASIPAGLVESDWPRVAREIETHSDIIYLGADLTFPPPGGRAVSGFGLIHYAGAHPMAVAYSPIEHYKKGILVLWAPESGLEWRPAKELPAILALTDLTRQRLLYPKVGAPVVPAATMAAAPLSPEMLQQRAKIFSPVNGPQNERNARNPVHSAVLNYAIDHEGYFPPHLAALLCGHYIQPADLLDPALPTKPFDGKLEGLTENNWPEIAEAVNKHCDLLYCAGDVRLNPVPVNDRSANANLIVLFTRVVTPPTGGRSDYRFVYKAVGHGLGSWSFADFDSWRTDWAYSNQTRNLLGLPSLHPDNLPPVVIPRRAGYVAPGTPDPSAPDRNRIIAARNLAVLTHQLLANDYDPIPTFFDLWRFRRVSLRHLTDPDLHVPFVVEDLPPQVSGSATTVYPPWRGDDFHDEARFEYLIDFKMAALPKPVVDPAKTIVAYGKNHYNFTGRYVAYGDGTVRFVAYKDLPREMP